MPEPSETSFIRRRRPFRLLNKARPRKGLFPRSAFVISCQRAGLDVLIGSCADFSPGRLAVQELDETGRVENTEIPHIGEGNLSRSHG